ELKRMLAIDFDSDRLLEFIQLLRREVSLIGAISFGFPCSRFQYRFAIQHLTHSPQMVFNVQRWRRNVPQVFRRRSLGGCDKSRRAKSVGLQMGENCETGRQQYCRDHQDELPSP